MFLTSYEILHFSFNLFLLAILFFGSIGNFLVYKIYSSPALKKLSLSIYFRIISIIDTLNLTNLIFLYLRKQFGIDLNQSIAILCALLSYNTYTQGAISAWLMVIISLDRFFKIVYPRRFPILFNKSIQLTGIFTTLTFNYAYYSFITWNSMILVVNNLDDTNNLTINVTTDRFCWQKFDLA